MKIPEQKALRMTHLFIRLCGGISAATGTVALLGWMLKMPSLASFSDALIPMAPSSAVLFVLCGLGLLVVNAEFTRGLEPELSLVIGSLELVIALPLFVLSAMDIHPAIERLGFSPSSMFESVPIGHMSPLTGLCFVLVALSFLSSHRSWSGKMWLTRLALGSSVAVLIVSIVLLLAYLLGSPVLYGSQVIPPALSTSISFFALGLGLMTIAGVKWWPLLRISDAVSFRESSVLVIVFVVLIMGIMVAGHAYFKSYEKQYQIGIERQLSSIGRLKADELIQWRSECLKDGEIFMNRVFSGNVKRFFQNRNDRDAATRIRAWMKQMQNVSDYDLVMLLDARLRTTIQYPENKEPVRLVIDKQTAEQILSGQMAFQDFYRNDQDGRVYLKVLVPILNDQAPGRLMGVLALRIDPERHLYPMLSRWPVPSRTAETLIIRREGNDVLFLNNLRFQKNSALSLRIPMTKTRIAAVQAALGNVGIFEGEDYRGATVLTDIRGIPDSPWYMVARIDASEAYESLTVRLWETVAFVSVLFFGAGAAVAGVWRHRRVRFYRQQLDAVQALNASELRYRRLFESASDGILILDADTGVVDDVNPTLTALLGYSRDELVEKNFRELAIFPAGTRIPGASLEFQTGGLHRSEDISLRTAEGALISVEFVSNGYLVEGRKVIQCNVRDVTERRRAEEALRESESLYHSFIEQLPNAVFRKDRAGRYILVNSEFCRLKGLEKKDFIGRTPMEVAAKEVAAQGANGQAIKYAHVGEEVHEEILSTGMIRAAEEEYLAGDGSVMYMYVVRMPVFDSRRTVIGTQGIMFDITERKRAEEALRYSNERLRRFIDSNIVGILIANAAGDIIEANDYYLRLIGYTRQELQNGTIDWRAITPPEWLPADERAIRELREQGVCVPYEKEYLRRDGTRIPVYLADAILPGPGEQIAAFALDMTDLKRAEEALRKSEQLYRSLFENMLEGFAYCKMIYQNGRPVDFLYLDVNKSFPALTGLAGVVGRRVSEVIPGLRDSNPELFEIYGRVASGGKPEKFETYLEALGIWFAVSVYSPGPELFVAVFDNITQRKQSEEKLRLAEERYRSTLDHMLEGGQIIGFDWRYLYLNTTALEQSRRTRDELMGRTMMEAYPGIEQTRMFHELERAMRERVAIDLENEFTFPDGTTGWFHLSIEPVQEGIFILSSDITARKLAEQTAGREKQKEMLAHEILGHLNAIKDSEAMIGAIIQSIQRSIGVEAVGVRLRDGDDFPYYHTVGFSAGFVRAERTLCSFDSEGNVLRDEEGRAMLDCMCGNILCGRVDPTKSFFTERGSFRSNNTTRLLATTTDADRLARTRNRCNSAGYESVALIPLRSGQEIIGLLQLNDRRKDFFNEEMITALEELGSSIGMALMRNKAEVEIKELNARLEQRVQERTAQLESANRELEAFSYSVSHDLRAPLRGIDGWSLALAEDYVAALDDRAKSYINRVRSETQRMGNLIDDLLQLSRVTRAEIKRERIDLSALAVSVAERLRQAHPHRLVDFVSPPGLEVTGDLNLMEIALTNLLDNAWKFTATRSRARIEFGREKVAGANAFFVRDDGVGFAMDYASRLFGAFQRLHSSSQFPGTGIGLATVQRIVHRHGGRVWAKAREGAGATFYFTLQEGL